MIQPGDTVIFNKNFLHCLAGDTGTIKNVKVDTVSGRIFYRLTLDTAAGSVEIAYTRFCRTITIKGQEVIT